ncbi:hypothetical protein DFH09DRAFT_1396945 [Mycena vulgaris]|nr:hypothetical protein DFH09DRAFT_1483717 [Mycena vulgaris]KAJ6539826.1 hypothetical protein DFH09DRAFT_1396945 [Mycena vulgaris]
MLFLKLVSLNHAWFLRARSTLLRQDQSSRATSSLLVQDQGSPRKDHGSPRRIKAQGYLRPIFPVLFIPARARTTSRPSKYGLKVHHAPHLERHPIDGECSSPSPSPSLVALVPVICPSSRQVGRHRVSREAAEANETSGLQAASAVRAHAAPKTTNFTAHTSPLLLLRRAPTASLHSPPSCIALLATNDEKGAAWWATARATGTSGASPRARVGNGQRAHGLAPGRRGRGSG